MTRVTFFALVALLYVAAAFAGVMIMLDPTHPTIRMRWDLDDNDVLHAALNQGGSVVLARVDRATGAATVIGPTGRPTVYGLAFLCCHLFGTTERGELLQSTHPLAPRPSSAATR